MRFNAIVCPFIRSHIIAIKIFYGFNPFFLLLSSPSMAGAAPLLFANVALVCGRVVSVAAAAAEYMRTRIYIYIYIEI